MRFGYRLQQFWLDLTAKPLSESEWGEITAVLTPPQEKLFTQFDNSDQQHSFRVVQQLKENGQTHPDLLTAALLHDIGKTKFNVTIWERSLVVLAKLIFPNKLTKWGNGEAMGWKRPFAVKTQHPEWGASMVKSIGSTPITIALIRRHQTKLIEIKTEEDQLLQYLQWADDQN